MDFGNRSLLKREELVICSISPSKFAGSIYHFHPFLCQVCCLKKFIEIVPFVFNLAVHKFNEPLPAAETPHSTRQRFALRLTALFRCKTRQPRGDFEKWPFSPLCRVCWEVVWNPPPSKQAKGFFLRMSSMARNDRWWSQTWKLTLGSPSQWKDQSTMHLKKRRPITSMSWLLSVLLFCVQSFWCSLLFIIFWDISTWPLKHMLEQWRKWLYVHSTRGYTYLTLPYHDCGSSTLRILEMSIQKVHGDGDVRVSNWTGVIYSDSVINIICQHTDIWYTIYCWCFRNPAPPQMYKNPVNTGINFQPLVIAGFLNHQQPTKPGFSEAYCLASWSQSDGFSRSSPGGGAIVCFILRSCKLTWNLKMNP